MQAPPPPPQQQQYPMSSAELWDTVQRQQTAQGSSQYAGPPTMLHGCGGTMAPLPSYELPQQCGGGQQPMVLSGKPLPASAPYYLQPGGGHNMGGIAGVPSSLTSLPGGIPDSSTPSPPPGVGVQPQLYVGSPSLGMQQVAAAGAAPQVGGAHAGYSQLSSSMELCGMGVPSQLVPNPQMMMHPHQGRHVPMTITSQPVIKMDADDPNHPSSHSVVVLPLPIRGSPASDDDGEGEGYGSPTDCMGSGGLNKSRYRGVSYDRKKAKWRVQIKVAALGKSGVSVGYFDTEEAAARAYDRAAIGLLGRDNPNLQTNFDARNYTGETIPPLTGKTREEVKTTLKSERIKQAPRRRFTSRQRTSRFMGVGSSNRKNQWQARILVHGKVTHLGYYETEEEAAKVYDKVSLALHGNSAQTNFAASNYTAEQVAVYSGLDRENLQRALGVKPMDKSSRFRGVSKKKGKWEAKVMVNRRWAYRELFDSEEEAARAYDRALWRLKPKEAHSYVNFKDDVPPEIAHMLGEEAGGSGHGGGGGPRHRGCARGGALASSDEEVVASDGSEGLSDEDGSGGTPQPSWTTLRTSRSGRRLRGTAGSPSGPSGAATAPAVPMLQAAASTAVARASSTPNLHSAAAAALSPVQHMASAAVAVPPSQSGFVALPGGGLQLQFGVGAVGGVGGLFGQVAPSPGSGLPLPAPVQPVPGAGGQAMGAQPLLVRVGSETHLIPHQQQAGERQVAGMPDARMGALSGRTLGKRMSRIQSEPAFTLKEEPHHAADLSDLMNDRDLFKAFDLTGEDSPSVGGGGGGGGGAMGGQLDALDFDTSELLDFIKDMPDAAPALNGGAGARAGAGMFKSRSMGNLMDLSAPFFDEDDEALATMEYARPRKMSKSMSMTQLASLETGGGGGSSGASGSGRPPLAPSGDASKLGPLGKPIRRTNTFSSSLAVLQEEHREGRAADDHMLHSGLNSQHSSGDDLVTRLLTPSGPPEDDSMLASMLAS